ncbi:hypothetical protein HBH50_127330 [Parastagonospora nodorum]|nr:hypothetical protein HBH50_127330 [Parastagonospora nodorum]KAH4086557.1 hypothetical protein HBH48_136750 [Parastagonospora nodorum]
MRCPQDHRHPFDARRLPKLLKEILLIATRIRHCVTPCYPVCKHSCLLAHRPLIYIRIVPGDGVTQQRVSQPVHLDRVHDIEVYDATAASRYDITDVVLREEVVGSEGANNRLAEPILQY